MSNETTKAGRELDALVAERVMGWIGVAKRRRVLNLGEETVWLGLPRKDADALLDVPRYSTRIDEAWPVALRLGLALVPQSHNGGFRWLACDLTSVHYRADGILLAPKSDTERIADTAPLAICLAALATLEAQK